MTTIQIDTAEIASKLLRDQDFIRGLAKALRESLAEESPKASTVEELLQMKADFEAGHIQAKPWREVRQRANAIHS
ncbi:MAG: hypothetical protein FWG12_03010 [Holophagaceae bacterium]|nr:hypothetical protein [Holophagaceae bacterium]